MTMTGRARREPLNRTGTFSSSIVNPMAVQFSTSCASTTGETPASKFTSQPGSDRIICSAEILRTKGVNSKFRPRMAFRNSSTSENEIPWQRRNTVHGNVKLRVVTNARPAAMPVRFPFRLSPQTEKITPEFMLVQLARVTFKGQLAASNLANFDSVSCPASGALIPKRSKQHFKLTSVGRNKPRSIFKINFDFRPLP